jgi:hypothetical protein
MDQHNAGYLYSRRAEKSRWDIHIGRQRVKPRNNQTNVPLPAAEMAYLPGGSLLCAPSQNGGFAVNLHPHQATVLGNFTSASTGFMPVSSLLWAPSQNGCFSEWPQLHQWYVPGCISIT